MTENKFKAGDKVVAKKDRYGLTEGETYTVRSEARATGDNGQLRWVNLEELRSPVSDDGSFEERYFKLAAPVFKVGDRVRLCRDDYCGAFKAGDMVTLTDVTGDFVWFNDSEGDERMVDIDLVIAAADSNGNQGGTLTIQAGKYYRTRDGRKVGPMLFQDFGDGEPWRTRDTVRWWSNDGTRDGGSTGEDDDLIAEWQDEPAPAASEPKFKVGDRVAWTRVADSFQDAVITGTDYIYDFIIEQCGEHTYVMADELRTVGESPTTPAIVARLDNGQPLPATRPHVHASVADASKEATRLAKANPGSEFGVYEMVHTVTEQPQHEWQRLAAQGLDESAASELAQLSGLDWDTAHRAVLRA